MLEGARALGLEPLLETWGAGLFEGPANLFFAGFVGSPQ